MSEVDWLSQLLQIISVTGRLEVRCAYGAPWRVVYEQCAPHEIPYHVVLKGRAYVEDPEHGSIWELNGGDIVLLPHGSAHVLHDGSGQPPSQPHNRRGSSGWVLSKIDGSNEPLDMLCGRFLIGRPHDRLIREYMPTNVVVRTTQRKRDKNGRTASSHLISLMRLMRTESDSDKPGGCAILNALTAALFTLTLRAASESDKAPVGFLAVAGNSRLIPAISAMFADPAHAWSLTELASLCNMSRATFTRHCHDKLGRTAIDLLLDIRMSTAANELKKPNMTTEIVAESVGYQSIAAFRRAFTEKIGLTPGKWRRQAHGDRASC